MTARLNPLVIALVALLAVGCASVVNRATDRFASNLGSAVLNADEPATVRDGLPAYLLLLDGLLEGDPENVGTLLAAANLNGAYAGNFTGTDTARAQRLSSKALAYAKRATCVEEAALCATLDGNPDDFAEALKRVDDERIGLMRPRRGVGRADPGQPRRLGRRGRPAEGRSPAAACGRYRRRA
jgi:hypothetical protein